MTIYALAYFFLYFFEQCVSKISGFQTEYFSDFSRFTHPTSVLRSRRGALRLRGMDWLLLDHSPVYRSLLVLLQSLQDLTALPVQEKLFLHHLRNVFRMVSVREG